MPSKKQAPAAFPTGADPLAVAPLAIANVSVNLAGFSPATARYDEAEAKQFADDLRSRLTAITPDRIVTARVDIDAVARALFVVHAFITQAPGILDQFEALHNAALFQLANVEDLRKVACAVLYWNREVASLGALKTNAKIPASLDEASTLLEREMQRVCEHNLADEPEAAAILDALRPGTSYLDRADDLLGYAKLYESHHAIISKDTKYKSSHVADARKLAGEIIAAMGDSLSPRAREDYDFLQRAWTLLIKIYAEVQETGLYLLRHDPQRAQRFPSIFVVGRSAPTRKPSKKDGDDKISPAEK